MVGGGRKSNGVLPNPSLKDGGSVWRCERSSEPMSSWKGRDGEEALVAYRGACYSDGRSKGGPRRSGHVRLGTAAMPQDRHRHVTPSSMSSLGKIARALDRGSQDEFEGMSH